MWVMIKAVFSALLLFGSGYAVFFFIGHFTPMQSVLLTLLGMGVVTAYRTTFALASRVPGFEPFWVSVQPNWYALCQDYGLYDVARWEEFQERWKDPTTEYSILRKGVMFTMLSPTLFFSNDHHSFFGKLDIKASVEELKPEHAEDYLGTFPPQFYIKRGRAGNKKVPVIEFGLVTSESLKRSPHPTDDRSNLPVAYLPESVFFGYMHPDGYNYDTMTKIEEETTAQLGEFAWTRKERNPEDSWLHWPYEINHKYVTIKYRGID